MSLGSEIARLRLEKGLLQKELAAIVGVRQSHMARWEHDQMRPRQKMLEKLAQALEVSLEALLASDQSEQLGALLQAEDPSLVELLRQVHRLEPRDREALRAVLESMLVKTNMHEMLRSPGGTAPSPVSAFPSRNARPRSQHQNTPTRAKRAVSK